MERHDRDIPDEIDARLRPVSWRQVGDGANIKVIAEGGFDCFTRQVRTPGESNDDFVDELGASEPIQISNPPQHGCGKRQIVINTSADECTV